MKRNDVDYYGGNFTPCTLNWCIQMDIRQRDEKRRNESTKERHARAKAEIERITKEREARGAK